ncbi:PKD domain-containing protein [Chryseobacterium foetidum]|uniref:PKD domain-containing protein n=1 Tax=Chryseobacterium foetidum TaxID=2951057 RepID=UPI0021CA53C4|nr:PKD domain-containing protein [Chryseobacterium foetidum]
MKNQIYFGRMHLFRCLLLIWLVCPWVMQAQIGTHITSNFQVGCTDYRGGKEDEFDNGVTYEQIAPSPCIKVCAGSQVNYTVNGQNISNVQWSAAGGSVGTISGAGNTVAQISWNLTVGSGSVQALITYNNGTTETQTICIEKINGPTAKFAMMNLDVKVCKGTVINFDNLSQDNGGAEIISYFWDFGDNSPTAYSTAFEPTHTFNQAGSYQVSLTVTNKCGCSDTYRLDIEVLQSTPVQINCASVVCEGSTEKYSVQDGCKDGEWKVIGGHIAVNNGNEIEVIWDQVDPADGFGYVMYKSKCGCEEWTTIKIPVILSNGQIQGPPVVCKDKQYIYSLPQWPTTNFQWNMSGPGGQLIYNQQRNEVIFQGSQPGTYTLWCSYRNTLLLCEGYASMTIVVEEPVAVSGGSDEVCVGANQTFTASPNVPVSWTVSSGSNTVYVSPLTTQPFTYQFSTAGYYSVTAAKQGGGCESNARFIKVLAPPAAPTGTITGDNLVCAGKPYVYTLNPVNSGTVPVWEVIGGVIQGSNTGNSVTIIFNAGAPNYTISVRNKSLSAAGCLSNPVTKTVSPIDLNTISVNPNGGIYCPSSSQTFTANLNGIVPDTMEWYFDNENFGSFANGQGTASVIINFNEISNTPNTVLHLKIVKCGVEKIIDIPLSLYTLPSVNFISTGPICLGSDLTFDINEGSIPNGTNVIFTFANTTFHPTQTDGSGHYVFANNGYIQNNSGANVSQTVTVTYSGSGVCSYTPTASATFTVFPQTFITVSPVYNIVVCDPSTISPYTLTANSSTGLTNTTGWEWFHNGNSVGFGTTYVLSGSNIFGSYYVQATDQNGCIVRSPEIKVTQDCTTNGCTADPQINFTPTWTSCNTINVSNVSYIGTPDEIQWGSDSVLTLVSGQGTLSPVYSTTLAGAHIVFLKLRYGNCWYSTGYEVRKKYEPKFNISTTCNGSGYTVTLHNTSTIFDITSPINYQFSGGGQPSQNGQTATYNLAPGTYAFTMTMQGGGFPNCTTTQIITLEPLPSVNFTAPASVCRGEVFTLNVPGTYSPNNIYTWYFDNTSYVTSQPSAAITINSSNSTVIKLKIKTPNGCEFVSGDVPITINLANLDGDYDFYSSVGCVGNGPTITVIPSGNVAHYIWMNGSQQVPNAPDSPTFTPSESGSYWPILQSAQGCKSYAMSTDIANITLLNVPYVNISGKANICANQSTTLTGIVTDNNVEYRWGVNSPPSGPWTLMPVPAPIIYNTVSLAAGTYTYYLEVRPAGTTNGCVGSKSFTVNVSIPPAAPVISFSLQSCQPYKVLLTASGSSQGQYNWSNGMSGQSIEVFEGGAYQVTYTAPSGCKVSSQIQVPLSIESLMWVFPTGCYDECRGDRYVIGPKGIFDSHEWQLFGNNIQSGVNDFIYPLFMSNSGTYQLQIDQLGCQVTSGTMNFYPGVECGIEPECKFDAHVESVKWNGDHFILSGVINNYSGQPMTITVSSLNGWGSYIPSVITIPPGGTYDMFTNPIAFYPNPTFPGGADEIFFDAGNGCKFITKVEIPDYIGKAANPKYVSSSISEPLVKIFPNPAKENVTVSFNTGNDKEKAKQIQIFDVRGSVKYTKELKSSSGELGIQVDDWLQGVYIVIIHTDGKALQGKLLKK